MVKRLAFTMIELIFAIVIISIAVVSLPVMTQTTDKNLEANIVQEAIFASEAVINESIAYYWDGNSQFDQNISGGLSRVINTGDCNATTGKRPGHVKRQCLSNNLITPADSPAFTNAMDFLSTVYIGTSIFLNNSSTTAYATYKQNYTATATINRCVNAGDCTALDQTTPTDRDLKEIRFDISDNTGIIVQLRAYSANIGEVTVESEVMP